jgi:hypothetical protein
MTECGGEHGRSKTFLSLLNTAADTFAEMAEVLALTKSVCQLLVCQLLLVWQRLRDVNVQV